MELEKKFLLKEGEEVFATFNVDMIYQCGLFNGWHFVDTEHIQQGYLNPDFAKLWARDYCMVDILFPIKDARIRQQGRELTLAFKSDGGLSRHKVEIPIDEYSFNILWNMTEGQRVIKTRYVYSDGQHEIKINVYKNLPLVVAEVEFLSEEEANAFKPFGKDVTEDPKYKNRNLVA
jgi:CYTH domain-containing protein